MSSLCTYEQLRLMCCLPASLQRIPRLIHSSPPLSSSRSVETVPFLFDLAALLLRCRQVRLLFSGFNSASVNRRLCEFIVDKLATLCEKDIVLDPSSSGTIAIQIESRRRHGNESTKLEWPSAEEPNWRCFLKRFGETLLYVVLIPTSPPPRATVDGDERKPAIPIYLYECVHSSLFLQSDGDERTQTGATTTTTTTTTTTDDVYVDYRLRKQRLPLYSASATRHLLIQTTAFARTIAEAYNSSFVESVFACLQVGDFLDDDCIDAVIDFDLCDESLMRFDLTEFVAAVCSHYRPAKSSSSALPSRLLSKESSDSCETDASGSICRAYGEDIRTEFATILNNFFRLVPTNSELFYFVSRRKSISASSLYGTSDGDAATRTANDKDSDDGDDNDDSDSRSAGVEFVDTDLTSTSDGSGSFEEVSPNEVTKEEVSANRIAFNWSGVSSETDDDFGLENDDDPPLFISLACAVKVKKTGEVFVTVPLTSIPTCIGTGRRARLLSFF